MSGPPGLRERLDDLITRISSSSHQAPSAAQSEAAVALKQAYEAVGRAYAALPH